MYHNGQESEHLYISRAVAARLSFKTNRRARRHNYKIFPPLRVLGVIVCLMQIQLFYSRTMQRCFRLSTRLERGVTEKRKLLLQFT